MKTEKAIKMVMKQIGRKDGNGKLFASVAFRQDYMELLGYEIMTALIEAPIEGQIGTLKFAKAGNDANKRINIWKA